MAGSLRRWYGHAVRLGIDPLAGWANLRGVAPFAADLRAFRRAHGAWEERADWPLAGIVPCLADRHAASGAATGHYFHQDLLVARRVHARAPRRHVDVGSRIDGFVAHVASFRPIQVFDIRPLESRIPNVEFVRCDIMGRELPESLTGSCDSLSCLHALEHFGLGRYGDPIRPDGHLAALGNLARIVAPDGWLYLSVPIGPQRIEFNAHRVFAASHLLALVEAHGFGVHALSIVDDHGALHEDVDRDDPWSTGQSFGCDYGLAIVEAVRRR